MGFQQGFVVGHVLVDHVVQLNDDAIGKQLADAARVHVVVLGLDDVGIVAAGQHRQVQGGLFVAGAQDGLPFDFHVSHLLHFQHTDQAFVDVGFIHAVGEGQQGVGNLVSRQGGAAHAQQHHQRQHESRDFLHTRKPPLKYFQRSQAALERWIIECRVQSTEYRWISSIKHGFRSAYADLSVL